MEMSVLHRGRPADLTGRLPIEVACYGLLDGLGIAYGRVDHEHADTIAACELVEGVLGAKICKNLFLCNRQKTKFYLLVMDGEKPFHTKDLSKQIGSSRLSFAPAEEMVRLLGTAPGSASILGLMNDIAHEVTLLLDAPVTRMETFGCHPCRNTTSLVLPMADVLGKLLPHLGVEPVVVDLPDDRDAD